MSASCNGSEEVEFVPVIETSLGPAASWQHGAVKGHRHPLGMDVLGGQQVGHAAVGLDPETLLLELAHQPHHGPLVGPGQALGGGHPDAQTVLGTLKAFVERDARPGAKPSERWQAGINAPLVVGRADSGDIEIDLVELFTDVAGLAADQGTGVAVFIDEMQDLGPDDVSALCAACHELGQQGLPLIVVGAGLPHLPAVLSASKSYSERLFGYARIDRLDRDAADLALSAPAADEDAAFTADALAELYRVTGGYPYFVQAYGKVVWDLAPGSPIGLDDVAVAAPEAEQELAVGFFGSRLERATAAEREYLRAMADADPDDSGAVPSAAVAEVLGRKPQSVSPARDALIKKGLIYASERGRIAFTVPHFGRFLRGRVALADTA